MARRQQGLSAARARELGIDLDEYIHVVGRQYMHRDALPGFLRRHPKLAAQLVANNPELAQYAEQGGEGQGDA